MFQRKLEKLEKYLPYFFRDWTITYTYIRCLSPMPKLSFAVSVLTNVGDYHSKYTLAMTYRCCDYQPIISLIVRKYSIGNRAHKHIQLASYLTNDISCLYTFILILLHIRPDYRRKIFFSV